MNSNFLIKRNLLPDPILRWVIRKILKGKYKKDPKPGTQEFERYTLEFNRRLTDYPIAIETSLPNVQHYEVPPKFFETVLGPYMKYSCLYYSDRAESRYEGTSLEDAEIEMLQMTVERAQIEDGNTVLDLGCGWGSLSLFIAENLPGCQITALSNSSLQKEYITKQIKKRGLKNLKVITADITAFDFDTTFDHVVSIEMFEHMRNYEKLFHKLHNVLRKNGTLFIHIFARRGVPYLFEASDKNNWMAQHFFTGGTMPNQYTLPEFAHQFKLIDDWTVNGLHYHHTLEDWLTRMDENKTKVTSLFEETYGKRKVKQWWAYWRTFFIICSELFAYDDGNEWFVKQYLFRKQLKLETNNS